MERRFGKYTLVERLGGGGMAEVYRARLHGPQGFEKDVALKLILPQFSDEPDFVKMFVHEATVAARLDHASIVRIHEFDVIDGTYYIAMELVEGKDLRALLSRAHHMDRQLTVPESLLVALEVARGLAFAHGELTSGRDPIIHRDISPHNIIISRAGEVKITDFGIAKAASAASLTRTGVVKGKAAYMAPEQARGEPVDTRSDIFSLGCVLWEMLAGQRLFTGENDYAILEKLHKSPIHPPSRYHSAVPPDLDRLVLKCLERDMEKRVQNVAELVREFDRLLVTTGADRTTLLADLYQSLFSESPRHTQVLAAAPAWPVPVRPLSDSSPPGAVRDSPPADSPGQEAAEQSPAGELPVAGPATEPDLHAATEIMTPRTVSHTQLLSSDEQKTAPAARYVKLGGAVLFFLLAGATAWWIHAGDGSAEQGTQPPEVAAPEMAPAANEAAPKITAASPEPEIKTPSEGSGEIPTAPLSTPPIRHEAHGKRLSAAPDPATDGKMAAAAAARKIPPTAEFGTLELNAIPWAKVYQKGRLLGDTPLRNLRLPAGEYSLLLTNDELNVRRTEKIVIEANQVTRKVIDLRPAKP